MKIGVLTSAYPEFEDDPHGIFVHRLMKEIQKKGYSVKVLAPFTGGERSYILEGVEVERFNYFYPKRFQKLCGRAGMIDNVKEGFLVKIQVFSFLFFNIFHSLLKFRDVNLVHLHWAIPNGLGALFLKKIYGVPYITTIYGEEVYLSKRYHMLSFLRYFISNSSKSIIISEGTLKKTLDVGFDEKKLEVIPFGVDTNFFKPIKLNESKNYFKILSVGYLIERKGFEYLILAIKEVLKHENVKLDIVGSGPLEDKLNTLIKDLNLSENVKILKNVSDNELLNIYNSSDLFVLPSIIDSQGNTEGLGVVLLEAMACGLPVIGSNVGGIPDIIKDRKTGLLVPQKNSGELSKSIIELIRNDEFRDQIAIKGYNMVNTNFSWDMISKSYIKVYNKYSI